MILRVSKPIVVLIAALALSGCGAIPAARERARVEPRALPGTAAIERPQDNACLAGLGAAGTRFSPLPDQYFGAGCQTVGSVRVNGLTGDDRDFTLVNLGPVSCPLATSLAAWARYGVDRAARQMLGSPLARIETMGSYACRSVAGSTRLSAHARAEAIDVAGFVLADGRRISVKADWNAAGPAEREFLRVVHRSACKRFGTVLGPDYNAAHRDHFHLEQGDGSFCR